MEVRPPDDPLVWGIQVGVVPKVDKVTALLDEGDWDAETVTTAASTAVATEVDDASNSDGEETDDEWAAENRYLDPPDEPFYNGTGEPLSKANRASPR